MKGWFYRIILFSLVFGIGTLTTYLLLDHSGAADLHVTSKDVEFIPQMVLRPSKSNSASTLEFTNVHLPEEFENGDFHYLLPVEKGKTFIGKCYLDSRMHGPWLGFFRRGDKYALERVDARFGRPERDDFGSYVPIRFHDSPHANYLFDHDDKIKPGPVTTLLVTPTESYDDMLVGSGFHNDFTLGGRSYVLRVSEGVTDRGAPVDVLVLETQGKQELLYYRSSDDGNFGQIEWAGDLDGDKSLDLIFSFFDENGGGKSSILFLSSAAKEDHLVQPYAFFHSADKGC